MNQSFVEQFAEVFDVTPEAITDNYKFDGPDSWDSLAIISTIALVDQYFDVSLKAEEFLHCADFNSLISIIELRKKLL